MPGLEDPDLEPGEIADAPVGVITKEESGVVEPDHLPCPGCGGEMVEDVCQNSGKAGLACDAKPLWHGDNSTAAFDPPPKSGRKAAEPSE